MPIKDPTLAQLLADHAVYKAEQENTRANKKNRKDRAKARAKAKEVKSRNAQFMQKEKT